MNLIETIEQEEIGRLGRKIPVFAPGDTVIVSVSVVEGERMDRVIAARAEAQGVSFDAMKEEYLRKISLRRMVTT